MHRFAIGVLCAASVLATATSAQTRPAESPQLAKSAFSVEPLKVPAGTVLAFHLQTRLRPVADDPLDALPQGTLLHVKILRGIDSTVQRDGSEFHGWVVSDLALGNGVVIHADSEVRGLLVLLRSSSHPDGFRYELLLTELTDDGKSYPLTASLSASFFDASPRQVSSAKANAKDSLKPNAAPNTKPVETQQ